MYQDVYIEDSVHRVVPGTTKILNVVLVVITVMVAFQFVFINYAVFGLPLVVMVITTYFVRQNTKIDFDYAYTNGLLEITKVYRMRKRKEIVACEMNEIVVLAKSRTKPVQPYIGKSMKTFDCTSHREGVVYYTMIVSDQKAGSEMKILFEPNEEMLQALHRAAPDKVHL